jgi:prevent-host-death family protein
MKHLSVSEAKAKFSELLDEVEQGETIVITRHGKVVAQLSPNEDMRRQKAREAIKGILELRKTAPRATVEEILQWRDEGRRF